ncbi:MAG: hypothetical protein JNL08_18235 [Planctomycetes bacterium]|nr:hypothetical protein [Planctomycetota bacterium]
MTDPGPVRPSLPRRLAAALRRATPRAGAGAGPRGLAAVWEALGRSPLDCTAPGQSAWDAAVQQIRLQHDAMLQAQQLLLRTTVAEEQLRLTHAALGALVDGVLLLDPTERIVYANTTARRVLQVGDQPNQRLEQAAAPFAIVEGIRAVLGADLAHSVKTCRIECEDQGRRLVYLIRDLTPSGAETPQHVRVVVLEDWTAEERASRAKSEFIYSVSHELKTPLTAIQASLELANEPAALSADDRDKLIRVSYEESIRLSQMVAELLDLARIEAGLTEFRREQVDMRALFDGLRALHQPLCDRKSILLRWDISDYLADLTGDARLLRQALVNVIGNAVKYTKDGGEVSVTARLQGAELVTTVRDTGIGIAEEDLPRVFEKFFRAKSAEQSAIQGTGLGLPMARFIVEKHQGRIELSSQLGVGTEFRIFLPVLSMDTDEEGTSSLVSVDESSK